ncbi:MAG: hypothetical protein RLZZ487_1809, partial [Pseudomonadota bacterium]
ADERQLQEALLTLASLQNQSNRQQVLSGLIA